MKKKVASTLAALAGIFMLNGTVQAAETPAPLYTPTYEMRISQPMIDLENKDVQKIINSYMMDYAFRLQDDMKKWLDEGVIAEGWMHSLVTYKTDKLVSINTFGDMYLENSAHPANWQFGKIFSLEDGHIITLKELSEMPEFKDRASHYTPNYIRAAVYQKYGKYLYGDPAELANIDKPQDYYIDTDGNVHVVFQEYDIAPYAAGILDVNLDKAEGPVDLGYK